MSSGSLRRASAGLAVVLLSLLLSTPALARYTGTDVFQNVSPPSQSGGALGPHPSSYFALDMHVDAGLTNPGGYAELIPHVLASQLWDVTRFLVLTTISLFGWAFSLDLLSGGGSGQAPSLRSSGRFTRSTSTPSGSRG
ncbi:MAG TPA: hypothetical protein VF002_03820 [Gaiellaceae bacterium]